MKNKEKYTKEIVDIVCEDVSFGVDKRTGSPVSCRELHCGKCLLNEMNRYACYDSRKEWADSEYVERPVISKNDRTFLDYIRDEDKYIARDANGKLFTYKSKPCKIESFGSWTDVNYDGLYLKCNVDFPMIKWGDDEPWLIEDLKKLEVVDEY
ncbi:MAG: hypothetical protein ACLT50_00925 [Mediterraneibacter faecis]